MSCSKPKCRNKADDPMISCWLCNAVYHAKCVDLAARTADNLREDKGLRWCCKKCIIYDVEFYSFFKNARDEFVGINNDLKCLSQRFLKFKALFDNASFSPKRKKTTPTLNSSPPVMSTNNSSVDQNTSDNLPRPSASTISSIVNVPVKPSQNPKTNPSLFSSSLPHNTEILQPNTNHIQQIASNINFQNDIQQINSHPPAVVSSPLNNPAILKVISPKKTIFAARFSSDTTSNAVADYIKLKLGYDCELSVFKFNYSEKRSKSSFKIIVPEEYFNIIVNPEFWPPNAIIREYEYRNASRSDIAYLPTQNNTQKN